jgi:signal peptidase II
VSHELQTEIKPRHDARPWLLLIALVAIALDRLTKILVVKHVPMGTGIVIIPSVFRVTHVLNTGAAFSMFADSGSPMVVRYGLISFSLIAAIGVLAMLWRYGRTWSPAAVGFALVLGGAIGNLYDRVVMHYVVDFLEVHIVHYHFPDFNFADSCITVGATLLILEMIWPKPEPRDEADLAGDVRGA